MQRTLRFVVFAIAGTVRERDKRRAPHVDRAVLSQIAHWPDREIDGAIDLAEAGTSLAGPGIVDDGEKLQGSRRHAATPLPAPKRPLHPFRVALARHHQPY